MAAINTISLSARQPFGVVGELRLRLLESTKNHQNNIQRPSPSKRSLEDLISNTENIAPPQEDALSKRKKFFVDDDVAASKYILSTTVTPPPTVLSKTPAPLLTMNSPDSVIIASPTIKSPLTAPAGRSPPRRKSINIFAHNQRSPAPSPKRFGPTRLLAQHNSPRVPFSVATALNGTFSHSSTVPKQSSTLNPASNRRQKSRSLRSAANNRSSSGWNFEIHADTPQEEITNLMEHSTSILDISDDGELERRRTAKGKENIPPPSETQEEEQMTVEEYTGPVTRSRAHASKNVTMSDSSRIALAELNPQDFATEEQVQSDADHASSDEEGHEDWEHRDGTSNGITQKDEEVIQIRHSRPVERQTSESARREFWLPTRRLTRAAAASETHEGEDGKGKDGGSDELHSDNSDEGAAEHSTERNHAREEE
ncbi:hypothetical protein KEM54_002977 [Ascosphaera aggregata]|nr:hypothetical protein KEM54_002977 [Ascosphaera aggregata]